MRNLIGFIILPYVVPAQLSELLGGIVPKDLLEGFDTDDTLGGITKEAEKLGGDVVDEGQLNRLAEDIAKETEGILPEDVKTECFLNGLGIDAEFDKEECDEVDGCVYVADLGICATDGLTVEEIIELDPCQALVEADTCKTSPICKWDGSSCMINKEVTKEYVGGATDRYFKKANCPDYDNTMDFICEEHNNCKWDGSKKKCKEAYDESCCGDFHSDCLACLDGVREDVFCKKEKAIDHQIPGCEMYVEGALITKAEYARRLAKISSKEGCDEVDGMWQEECKGNSKQRRYCRSMKKEGQGFCGAKKNPKCAKIKNEFMCKKVGCKFGKGKCGGSSKKVPFRPVD